MKGLCHNAKIKTKCAHGITKRKFNKGLANNLFGLKHFVGYVCQTMLLIIITTRGQPFHSIVCESSWFGRHHSSTHSFFQLLFAERVREKERAEEREGGLM